MHYVVAGTGYTGRRVLGLLPFNRGIGLSRSPLDDRRLTVHALDLDRGETRIPSLPAPWTLLYTVPPRAHGAGDPRLAALLAGMDAAPARVVYLSTSGVYGDRGGRLTDETAAVTPRTDRARRRLSAESLLEAWCDERGAECLIFRVPGIYGPGRLGIERLRGGAAVLCEADSGPGNRIHVDDLARCCLTAMTADVPAGIYNVGDGDHRSSGEFSKAVARLAGLAAPPEITLADARREWSAQRLSFLNESRRLDTRKMRKILGVTPRYEDPEEGIRASLAPESADTR